jgi:hypothetical protein
MKKLLCLVMIVLISGCASSKQASALATWRSTRCPLEQRLNAAKTLVPLTTPFAKAKQILGQPSGMMAAVIPGIGIANNAEYKFDNGIVYLCLRSKTGQNEIPGLDQMIVTIISSSTR